jgi:predicted permease
MSVELRVALLMALFVGGWLARRTGWLGPQHAGVMLQSVIYVGLPALFLADVSRVDLQRQLLALPLSGVIIVVITLPLALAVGRAQRLSRADQGTLAVCGASLNNGFLFPFVVAAWGQTAFAQLALFDSANALCQACLVCVVAAIYGGRAVGAAAVLRRALTFPPLWAMVAALLLNVSHTALPAWLTMVLGTLGRSILLLVIIALGVLFDARLLRDRRVLAALTLRMLVGLLLGLALAEWFGLTGLTRAVLILGAAAPIGFSAVVIANREGLNAELAASAASLSVALALVGVPLALWLLPR